MPKHLMNKKFFSYDFNKSEIDEINFKILQELQLEPRLTMTELGRRVGLSSPSVTERVRRLEESEVIKGYSLDLNPAALGLPIGVYIRIRPNSGKLSIIAELALSIPEVVECHRISGEDCFILKVYIPAIDQLDRILDQFLLYGSTTTTIIQSSPIPMKSLPIEEIDENVGK
ncbi:Lrp/AsnC family transcriptional regulator [Staphylococcus arlettae]|jgi:Lrp/AsnC family leucine-responsive transcriptional regulator|uniref:Lrp/AsnC family transcriptional regulator n=1 Tax=Staphylococcaceae TaxID=90964 RepID=UPI001C4FC362|nr:MULTISPECIES: Lrp/AsnC family transcriptional regulator [Bacillales]MEB7422885.1 Lrp/AsnC family transcriptional regulator [Staphylococcus arlettae]HLR69278.1 Lrp/AsnC family transcriptional regulator [Virgibacillus sp.]